MLVASGGLPGNGKTTLRKPFEVKRSAAYVRSDEIEHASTHREKLSPDIGAAGVLGIFPDEAAIADADEPEQHRRNGMNPLAIPSPPANALSQTAGLTQAMPIGTTSHHELKAKGWVTSEGPSVGRAVLPRCCLKRCNAWVRRCNMLSSRCSRR